MNNVRSRHSRIGIASSVVALFPILAFAIYIPLVLLHLMPIPVSSAPRGVLLMTLVLMMVSVILEIGAVGMYSAAAQ